MGGREEAKQTSREENYEQSSRKHDDGVKKKTLLMII